MPEVSRKFDRWLDLVLVHRILDGPTQPPAASRVRHRTPQGE
jgi:hypothetical protein